MLGLLLILAPIMYIVGSVYTVIFAARIARKHDRNPKFWGFIVGFAAYLVVYWDHIPSVAVKAYHCMHDGGINVAKDPQVFLAQNPDVVADAFPKSEIQAFKLPNGATRRLYSPRVAFDLNFEHVALTVERITHTMRDLQSNDVLSQYTDYRRDYSKAVGVFAPLKWMLSDHGCLVNADNENRRVFDQTRDTFYSMSTLQ